MMKLALFDLDHTLIPIDSDHAWGEFTTRIGWTDAAEFKRRNDAFYAQDQAGTLDIHDYVRFATAAVRRHGAQAAQQAQARFMREVIEPAVKPAAQALLDAHQRAGDAVVIVTATNEFVTRPIATRLGVPDLIAVQLARGADGWITGEIEGVPSFREGKIARVEAWLESMGLWWNNFERSWFYSDSLNDLPLLQRVTDPVVVDPDATLRAHAEEAGWPILNIHA